jgi:hypothetical protein
MTGWPCAPVVYEVDTWPWLSDLRRRLGAAATLADLPSAVWEDLAPEGADAVWLMGVWERSPAGLDIARQDGALQRVPRRAAGPGGSFKSKSTPVEVTMRDVGGRL